jgi:hypothetical protein
MRAFVRGAYRMLLRLHPEEFRTEFGDEMLWIFDSQMQHADGPWPSSTYGFLLLDAVRSLVVQRALREHPKTAMVKTYFHLNNSETVSYIAQGGFVLFACLFSVLSIALFVKMLVSQL